jgi:type VI secretion system protein ImpF
MREPKSIVGARALLFDRLVGLDNEASEALQPFRILTCEQLKASVRRELQRLLNTRCSIPLHQITKEERSVINYGIPDFSSLSAHNPDDHKLIATIVSETITAFEPRLQNVRVSVDPVPGQYWMLALKIEALLWVDAINEPVSFTAMLNRNGAAELDDSQ